MVPPAQSPAPLVSMKYARSNRSFSLISKSSLKIYKEVFVGAKKNFPVAKSLALIHAFSFLVSVIGIATGLVQIRQPNSSGSCSSSSVNSSKLLAMQNFFQIYQEKAKNQTGKLSHLIGTEESKLNAERQAIRKEKEQLERDWDFVKGLLRVLDTDAARCNSELVSIA